MNYMKQVAEMLGVELGEKFKIKGVGSSPSCDYAITEKGLIAYCKAEGDDTEGWLEELMTGEATIVKKPWKPNERDEYYYISTNSEIFTFHYNEAAVDAALIAFGNCFRTSKEAAAREKEIRAKIREVLGK